MTADPPFTFSTDKLMRTWESEEFLVELYETNLPDGELGHRAVGYRLYDIQFSRETGDGDPIFQGIDYGVPSQQVIDGDDAVKGIIGFLSLRPGDTDGSFFEDYTGRQWTWMRARAEALSMWGLDGIDMATGEEVPEDEGR